jgi:osmotically inducible protein OsmC
MAIERQAHATWEGDLRSGLGRFEVGSGAITGQEVTFASRFQQPGGKTSPEELIAAAHATCVSMALANGLAQAGHAPTRLETDAVCTLDPTGDGVRITSMRLTVKGQVDGVDEDAFRSAVEEAKDGCPVSNALGGVDISVESSLSAA